MPVTSPAKVRQWLESSSRVVILTGAGMSAESGVPTFRGPDGLWRQHRPEELASPAAFAKDPKLVWEWYDWRRTLIARTNPHPGHLTLAQWEHLFPIVTVITQNVDVLHQRAGSSHVIEMHGSIWNQRCEACGTVRRESSGGMFPLPPICLECGATVRPGVVWFGENLPPLTWEASVEAVERADILLVVGTSGSVYPAARLAPLAHVAGARVVEINLAPSGYTDAFDAILSGPCGEILPQLIPFTLPGRSYAPDC